MIALSFRFPHHGAYSSYHRLLAYLSPPDRAVDATLPRFVYSRYLNPRGLTQRYWLQHAERKAWRLAGQEEHDWLHYLYPEHGYFRGAELRTGRTKIAVSGHLPQSVVEQGIDRLDGFFAALRMAEAVIVMSPDSVDFYRSLAPSASVVFIPHGVDTHYFSPAGRYPSDGRRRLLTVGNMLRDFETLAAVINTAAERDLAWTFTVIANRDRLQGLAGRLSPAGRQLFQPLYGIPDDALLQVYRTSDLLFLPLLDATANNALIEAMACGLPILVTDLASVRGYAADSVRYLATRDRNEICNALEAMVMSEGTLRTLAEAGRARATENLAWEVVAVAQRAFLRSVTAGVMRGNSNATYFPPTGSEGAP